MEVKAITKYLRISPRKARLVVGLIRNSDIATAREQLRVLPKQASHDVLKVLNSAVANAENNNKLKADDLVVTQAYVDEGPTLKRWRPRAFGRAAQIRKRTSHITIVVSDKAENKEEVKKDTRHKKQDTNKIQDTNSKDKKNDSKKEGNKSDKKDNK